MSELIVNLPKKLFDELEKRAKNSSFSKTWHTIEALKGYLQDDFDIKDVLEGDWKNA